MTDTGELVERLRKLAAARGVMPRLAEGVTEAWTYGIAYWAVKAADALEAQAREIERLRELIAGRYQTGGRSEIDYHNEIERLREEISIKDELLRLHAKGTTTVSPAAATALRALDADGGEG